MRWTADVSAGDWIRERLDPDGPDWASTMHAYVPRAFAAYARVFHRATRDRPVGEPWPPRPYAEHAREWDMFQDRNPEIEVEQVSWQDTAAAFDRRMHPLAQWHRIAADPHRVEGEDGPRDAKGWRYGEPAIGRLDPDLLGRLIRHGAEHTTTPADARMALWEGHGGLVGAMGFGPSRVLLTLDDAGNPRHDDFLAHSARDAFNDVFRKPSWQPGILPDDVSRGDRLRLPNRDHVLFTGSLADLSDPDWPVRAPWRDPSVPDELAGTFIESPSLVWPVDGAWVLVSEVDLDSTVNGGSEALVHGLCSDPAIEALPIPEGADLGWDGDEVNR